MESLDSNEDGPSNFSKIFNLKTAYEPEKLNMLKILKKAKQQGLVNENESKMIEKVLSLKDVSVYNVMTHRIKIKAVEKTSKLDDVLQIFAKTGFSKIPVYEEDVDSIIGVIYAKKLLNLSLLNRLKGKDVVEHINKTVYVPESMKCENVLNLLIKEKQELAVVVDEYGGTSGIVTFEDIKNFVFNGISKNLKEIQIKTKDENSLVLEGKTSLKDVSSALNIKIKEENNTETLGGFLVGVLGRIPKKNENPIVSYGGVKFKILSMERRHIKQVEAVKLS